MSKVINCGNYRNRENELEVKAGLRHWESSINCWNCQMSLGKFLYKGQGLNMASMQKADLG